MAGKIFELERVLTYRRDVEKLRKQDFAVALQELDMATQELKREEALLSLLEAEFERCQHEIGCIDDIRMYLDFFARKREVIKEMKEQIEQLDQIMNEKKAELLEASKDKKMLESLKEKRAEEFRQDVASKERNFLDEITIQKKG